MTRLHVAPSEFWRMPPRHFWWLSETLGEGTKHKNGIGADERAQMLRLLEDAERAAKK